jgi:uncharacterized protein YecE (DUF72 family)
MDRFYRIVNSALKEKLGAILFQMPPSFKYSKENISRILKIINTDFTNVIEFRHKSWWNEEVFEIFREKNLIFCSISAPKLPEKLIKTSNIIYIRFHGKDNWYKYKYSTEELKQWAELIKKENPEVLFAYFNNDFYGYAPENALELIHLLGK